MPVPPNSLCGGLVSLYKGLEKTVCVARLDTDPGVGDLEAHHRVAVA